MNKFVAIIVLSLIAFSAMSQDSVRSTIEKAYKDPHREKNEAKADVFIPGKQIYDTTRSVSSGTVVQPVNNDPSRKAKDRKKQ